MTDLEAIVKELDSARAAYQWAQMSNAHPSFLATLSAEERVRRDATYREIQERYDRALDAYNSAVQLERAYVRATAQNKG